MRFIQHKQLFFFFFNTMVLTISFHPPSSLELPYVTRLENKQRKSFTPKNLHPLTNLPKSKPLQKQRCELRCATIQQLCLSASLNNRTYSPVCFWQQMGSWTTGVPPFWQNCCPPARHLNRDTAAALKARKSLLLQSGMCLFRKTAFVSNHLVKLSLFFFF